MLKTVLALLFVTLFFSNESKAAPLFFSFGGEKVVKVADFPDSPDFQNPEGRYVDAGIRYKQISIFFIPLWNYEEKWCGYVSGKMYVDVDKATLDELAAAANVTLPANIKISFWDKIGGKLVFIAIIAAFIFYKQNKRKQLVKQLATRPVPGTPPVKNDTGPGQPQA